MAVLPLFSCTPDPEPGPELPVALYQLERCRLPPALDGVSIELDALGDFVASNRTTEAVPASESARPLRFPEATRAVTAIATASDGARWSGVGERENDAVDVLLWPDAAPCELFSGEPFVPPGQALGMSRKHGLVLAVGNSSATPDIAVGGLLFDVATGRLERADMDLPRAFATVTESGDRLLVAGGQDPTDVTKILDDILVFDPATREFERPTTRLFRARAKHAAVLLPSGETLLVGGVDEDGAPSVELEAISAETLRTRVTELTVLQEARISPYAFTLSDGRIFVGGGELGVDEPATTVEWLTPDASDHASPPPMTLPPRSNRAFVPLPGGAVLAVGGCEPNQACPPPGGFDALWISPEGLLYPFFIDIAAPRPLLVSASDGAPLLVSEQRLYRFDPWNQRFDELAVAPDLLPSAEGPRPLAVDAGALVWFSERAGVGSFWGMRHDIRNRHSRDVVLLADPLRPAHMAPDRPPGVANGVVFNGRLELGAASVHVADTDYEDVSLEISVQSGPPPIVLFAETDLGGPLCPWPPAGSSMPEKLRVIRRDTGATLLRGDAVTTCTVTPGRKSIGLRGGGAQPSVVSQLVIRRGLGN